MFRFQDYPQTREAVRELLNEYISELTGTIHRTTSQEWQNSNDFQDLLVNKVLKSYGVKAKDGTVYERYYKTNSDHLKAFQNRTVNGMNLSRRVWNLSQQYKQELEMGMSVGIERGSSAASLAKGLKQYLKDPDRLFRRVRDKYGNLQLSKNAKAYHPGQGVYRSSYKNALRLTRSETNMAYRTAEQNRWRQFDFVVGYEIKLSQSHPCHDVCDTLAGKYPKDFVWTGWHPMDMCYCVSILKSDDEFWRDFGGDNPQPSEKEVTDVPEAFKDWIRDNADRIEAAEKRGTQPYFIRDNQDKIDEILKRNDTNKVVSIKNDIEKREFDNSFREVKNPISDELKKRRAEIRELAKEKIIDKPIALPELGKNAFVSNKGVKEWLNQPHVHLAEKNELILDIQNVLNQSKYLGYGADKHDPLSAKAHIYEISIIGNKSWIIIRELHDGSIKIHSISDNEDILKIILGNKRKS